MKNAEKRTNENEFTESCCEASCCDGQGDSGMGGCCGSNGDHPSGMGKCMSRCRWFPLMPVILGVILLLLGYYLNAEITRILWMITAGFWILLGGFGLIMISRIKAAGCQEHA